MIAECPLMVEGGEHAPRNFCSSVILWLSRIIPSGVVPTKLLNWAFGDFFILTLVARLDLPEPLMGKEFPSSDGSKLRVAYKAVESWLVDKAVLPIESSVGGSIHRNYDLLLGHKLHIVGEVQLLINHCLLGLPGVRKEDLRAVMSHPQYE
ncbi:hypothetical protein JHK87_013840 [Glycine soja]|nr:hypothetical protein JHK87_013840 [Glycine soja]